MPVIICPGCQAQLRFPDVTVPTPGQCSTCRTQFLVPPVAVPVLPPSPDSPQKSARPTVAAPSVTLVESPTDELQDSSRPATERFKRGVKGPVPMPFAYSFMLAVMSLYLLVSIIGVIVGIRQAFSTGEGDARAALGGREVVDEIAPGVGFARRLDNDPRLVNAVKYGVIVGRLAWVAIRLVFLALAGWVLYGLFHRSEVALIWVRILAGLCILGSLRTLGLLITAFERKQADGYLLWADLIISLACASLLVITFASQSIRQFMMAPVKGISFDSAAKNKYGLNLGILVILAFVLNPGLLLMLSGDGDKQMAVAPQQQHAPPNRDLPDGALALNRQPQPPAERMAPLVPKPEPKQPEPPKAPPPVSLEPPQNPAPLPAGLMDKVNKTVLQIPGLIAYYAFEEPDGDTFYDASPFRNHGEGQNIERISGRRGRGITIHQSTIKIPANDCFNLNAESGLCISMWCRVGIGSGPMMTLHGPASPERRHLPKLAASEGSLIRLSFFGSKLYLGQMRPYGVRKWPTEIREGTRSETERWTHIAQNWRPGRAIEVWENGALIATKDQDWPRDLHFYFEEIEIGGDPYDGAQRYFHGDIDEVCIFRRYLNRDDIQRLVQSGSFSRGPKEVAEKSRNQRSLLH